MLTSRPRPFSAFTTPEFWNDPHISTYLLTNHLDDENPLASRPREFIRRSVKWLILALDLHPGSHLLDLGCGPGLYAEPIAKCGIEVLGIDVSQRALAHARHAVQATRLPITYRQGSYLDTDLGRDHDAAILIYEDYCALSPAQRAHLLGRVFAALRPQSWLVFDVTSRARFRAARDGVVAQHNLMDGFWASEPYWGTHTTWTYQELHLILDHYSIRTPDETRQFWNWIQCLAPHDVATELDQAGFEPPQFFGDVTGAPYTESSASFAVLARRR